MFKITKVWLENLQYMLLALVIITLPIISMPKAYQIIGLGGKLYIYPLIVGLILFLIEKIKFKTRLNAKICKYLLLVLAVQLISTFYGLIKFPYYNDVNVLMNEKFIMIANYLNLEVNDNIKYLFIALRSAKTIVMEFIAEWLLAFWVFHLFQNNFDNGFKKIRGMFIILAVLLSVYAIPEILYFKFNVQLGYDILCILNPYLYDPGTYLNWYPPIIYPNHGLKSYCIEPALLGLMAATILPFLFNFVFEYRKQVVSYIFYSYFIMILFMTKSRTCTAIIYIYALLMFIYGIFYRNFKRYILLILLIALGFLGAIFEFSYDNKPNITNQSVKIVSNNNKEIATKVVDTDSNLNTKNVVSDTQSNEIIKPNKDSEGNDSRTANNDLPIIDTQTQLYNSAVAYYNSNIETIASTTARSNGSRLNNILMHLNVVKENTLLGTGMGLKDLYINDMITENALQQSEVKMITDGIRKEGMFKYSYGNVNHYVYVLTNYGLIGFCLYFFPAIYLLYKIWKIKIFVNKEIGILLIVLLLNLAAMMTGNCFSVIFIIEGLLFTTIFNKSIK